MLAPGRPDRPRARSMVRQVVLRVGKPGTAAHPPLRSRSRRRRCRSASSKRPQRGREDARPRSDDAEDALDRRLGVAPLVRQQQPVERAGRVRHPRRRRTASGSRLMLNSHSASRCSRARSLASSSSRTARASRVPAELGVEVAERAAEAQQRGVLAHGAADRVLELRQAPLLAAEHEQRRAARTTTAFQLSARRPSVQRSSAISCSASSKRPSMSASTIRVDADVPAVGRLAQLVGEPPQRVRARPPRRRDRPRPTCM